MLKNIENEIKNNELINQNTPFFFANENNKNENETKNPISENKSDININNISVKINEEEKKENKNNNDSIDEENKNEKNIINENKENLQDKNNIIKEENNLQKSLFEKGTGFDSSKIFSFSQNNISIKLVGKGNLNTANDNKCLFDDLFDNKKELNLTKTITIPQTNKNNENLFFNDNDKKIPFVNKYKESYLFGTSSLFGNESMKSGSKPLFENKAEYETKNNKEENNIEEKKEIELKTPAEVQEKNVSINNNDEQKKEDIKDNNNIDENINKDSNILNTNHEIENKKNLFLQTTIKNEESNNSSNSNPFNSLFSNNNNKLFSYEISEPEDQLFNINKEPQNKEIKDKNIIHEDNKFLSNLKEQPNEVNKELNDKENDDVDEINLFIGKTESISKLQVLNQLNKDNHEIQENENLNIFKKINKCRKKCKK